MRWMITTCPPGRVRASAVAIHEAIASVVLRAWSRPGSGEGVSLPGYQGGFSITASKVRLRSADGIAESQPRTVGLAAAVIFLLVYLALGTLPLGVIGMLPNLLPVGLYFGLLGAGVAPLSLPTSIIGSVALGISIDDTVHTIVRYRHERRDGCSPEEAWRRTARYVGRAVGITSAASTPDDLVQEILVYFRGRNKDLEVVEEGEWENITFREPKRVAPAPVGS